MPFKDCYPLSEADLRRALANPGDWRMKRVIRHVAARRHVSIVSIGGSVSGGNGALGGSSAKANKQSTPSSGRFVEFLRHRYSPGHHIELTNLAAPATTSSYRTTVLDDVIAAKPDLVIWDYSSNDGATEVQSPEKYRSLMEQLTRQILALP